LRRFGLHPVPGPGVMRPFGPVSVGPHSAPGAGFPSAGRGRVPYWSILRPAIRRRVSAIERKREACRHFRRSRLSAASRKALSAGSGCGGLPEVTQPPTALSPVQYGRSALVGSITRVIGVIVLAGKPESSACFRIASSFSAR